MASSNQTLPGNSKKDFEADGTQRTATLNKYGGRVTNDGTVAAIINVEAATITATVQPLDVGSELLQPGDSVLLDFTCKTFTFKSTGASTYLKYDPQGQG